MRREQVRRCRCDPILVYRRREVFVIEIIRSARWATRPTPIHCPKVEIDLRILVAKFPLNLRQYAGVPALLLIQACAFQHGIRSNVACICARSWPRNVSSSCDREACGVLTSACLEACVRQLLSFACILKRLNDIPRKRIFDDGGCWIAQGKLRIDLVVSSANCFPESSMRASASVRVSSRALLA